MMESAGAMYVLKLAAQDSTIVTQERTPAHTVAMDYDRVADGDMVFYGQPIAVDH